MDTDVGKCGSMPARRLSGAETRIAKRSNGRRESGLAAVRRWLVVGTVAAAGFASAPLHAQTAPSPRVALVIGIGGYAGVPTPAAPNDAGLVAQTLQAAGFDVTAARDLDGDGLRRAFRDFLDKAGAAGPDGIAIVYLAGRAVQADGDNFFVPVDAKLARLADVPIETVRLGDFTHALAALPIEAKVVVVDAAYAAGPASAMVGGAAPGLALVDAEQGELIAFNAAPGSIAPATRGPYGVYAQALVQGMKQGGVPISETFDRVRISVDQVTSGAEIPWESDKLTRSFTFFDRGPNAPAVASVQIPFATLEKRPIREFPPDQAYDVAIARDTLPAYQEFLAAFPDDPLARRIRLIVSVRREALFWRATLGSGAPTAFWTYLARYPQGSHAADARRRLSRLAAAAAPPPDFRPLVYDVPPPPPGEIVVFERPLIFVDPGLPPPPPAPAFLLPPPVIVDLPPPPPPRGPRFLPIPIPLPIPGIRPLFDPGVIVPPRGVGGDYGRPRPYRRGPGGDGLVGEDAPERLPPLPPAGGQPLQPPPAGRPLPPPIGPLPGRPNPPPPQPLPSPLPPPPAGRSLPPAPLPVPPGRPGRPQGDGVAPGRPLPGLAPAPDAEPLRTPAPRPVPGAGPRPVPRQPELAPGSGGEVQPRPARPLPGPAPAPDAEPLRTPAPRPAPGAGPRAVPRQPELAPGSGGEVQPRPGRPLPGMAPGPETRPGPDAAPPRPGRPPGAPEGGVGTQRQPLPPPDAEPQPQGQPRQRPMPEGEARPSRPEQRAPGGEPPERAPGGPRPPGGERARPPEAGRGPGHPECGHPGQPPCG